jgi:hypothetical protein
MKTTFLKPRFTGPRFEAHTLPVEVAKDLAAYEELIVELAKHLYLKAHPARRRVPKGFEDSFSLHLEQIEEGSAVPVLACITAAGNLLPGGADGVYFDHARDLVADCVEAVSAAKPLPEAFPRELLNYFDGVGRSLRADEGVDLGAQPVGKAVLTAERRKQLVLSAQKFYTKEVELIGAVGEIDWEKRTFRLRLDNNQPVNASLPDWADDLVRRAGGVERSRVLLKGIGIYDAWDHLLKVSAANHLELSENHALATKLESLSELKPGWFEGQGDVPAADDLNWLTDRLVESYPADVAIPYVCATPEGGVFIEWKSKAWRASAEFDLKQHSVTLHSASLQGDDIKDETFVVNDSADLKKIFDFARQFGGAL